MINTEDVSPADSTGVKKMDVLVGKHANTAQAPVHQLCFLSACYLLQVICVTSWPEDEWA